MLPWAHMTRSTRVAIATWLAVATAATPTGFAQALPELQSVLTLNDGGVIKVVIEANGSLPMPTAGHKTHPNGV